MNPRISMITLGVDDLEASIKFYRDGSGFPKMDSPPEVAFFTLNGRWLGLYGRESLAEDAGVVTVGSGFPGFTLSQNVVSETFLITWSQRRTLTKLLSKQYLPVPSWLNCHLRPPGAHIMAISKTKTHICGRLPTTRSFGSAPRTKSRKPGLQFSGLFAGIRSFPAFRRLH